MPDNKEFHRSYHFTVKVDGITQAIFLECTLPTLQLETIDVQEGGQNTFVHKLPVRVTVGTVKLKQGLSTSLDLLKWYMQVVNGDMEKARRQVEVTMYKYEGEPSMSWGFKNAFPTRWTGPTLKTDQSALTIEELEIAHHGMEVQVLS